MVSLASSTVTANPARARRAAAARPLGPLPTTIAVVIVSLESLDHVLPPVPGCAMPGAT